MSIASPQTRARAPRWSENPGLRSRLSLVPQRSTRARRTPFVALICGILVAGVVGLLMFNTEMQQISFHATALQERASALSAEQQHLEMQLQRIRDPQRLALRARNLGMVVPADPAFVRLSDGHILGTPVMTTVGDGMRVRGFAAAKPARLRPPPRVVHVSASANSTQHSGAASVASKAGHGKKKTH